MLLDSITITAPGSTMVMGEHAVLHQQPAIVAAIDRWITVTLTPTQDAQLSLISSYGEVSLPITDTPTVTWAQWIAFMVRACMSDLPVLAQGLRITIESTFEGAVGLSSSTALTVAVLFGMSQWLFPDADKPTQQQWVFDRAMQLLKSFHKVASGAALQAVIYGGLRYFDSQAKNSVAIDQSLPFYLVYCGYKTPTEHVVKTIQNRFGNQKKKLEAYYHQMGLSTIAAYEALQENALDVFYQQVEQYFCLQKKIGVCDDMLEQMICLAYQSTNTLAAKISGAGLGDCILVMGKKDFHLWRKMQDVTLIEVAIVDEGVQVC